MIGPGKTWHRTRVATFCVEDVALSSSPACDVRLTVGQEYRKLYVPPQRRWARMTPLGILNVPAEGLARLNCSENDLLAVRQPFHVVVIGNCPVLQWPRLSHTRRQQDQSLRRGALNRDHPLAIRRQRL